MDGTTATTYAPNPLNQYASIVTGGTTFTPLHDVDGNLVNDGIRTYQWDGENRLEEVRRVSDNALIARYSYDYMSRRVFKGTTSAAPQGESSTVFIYDGWNLLAEYPAIHRSIAATTPAKRTYTWGLDLSGSLQGAGGVGGLLAVEEKASTIAQVRYPLYDGNGNVVGVDDGISAAAVYEYDAFGNTVYRAEGYADEMPFRFSTKYFDKETGFYYYGYRYFDPVTGRWPSRDPIEERGGVNIYSFVNNDPIWYVDILGRALKSSCEIKVVAGHANDVNDHESDFDDNKATECDRFFGASCYRSKVGSGLVWPTAESRQKSIDGTHPTPKYNNKAKPEDLIISDMLVDLIRKAEQAAKELCGKCCTKVNITVECLDSKAMNNAKKNDPKAKKACDYRNSYNCVSADFLGFAKPRINDVIKNK